MTLADKFLDVKIAIKKKRIKKNAVDIRNLKRKFRSEVTLDRKRSARIRLQVLLEDDRNDREDLASLLKRKR
jgi:hypothetical protein